MYINGNMNKTWERITGWEDDRRKGIKMLIGGDFNARTGELGGRRKWSDEKRKRERRSRDRKVNKEGRVSGLEEVGWYIFNRCEKGNEEEGLMQGKGESVLDYVIGGGLGEAGKDQGGGYDESDHFPVVMWIIGDEIIRRKGGGRRKK